MDPFPFPTPSISSAYTPDTMAANPPRNLQDHLYTSFLEGSTADVALHVSGSWYAVYKLHRVILIQAVSFVHLPYLCRRAEPTYPRRNRSSSDASLPRVSQNLASARDHRIAAVLSRFPSIFQTRISQDQVCLINLCAIRTGMTFCFLPS